MGVRYTLTGKTRHHQATNLNIVHLSGYDATDVRDLTTSEMEGRYVHHAHDLYSSPPVVVLVVFLITVFILIIAGIAPCTPSRRFKTRCRASKRSKHPAIFTLRPAMDAARRPRASLCVQCNMCTMQRVDVLGIRITHTMLLISMYNDASRLAYATSE